MESEEKQNAIQYRIREQYGKFYIEKLYITEIIEKQSRVTKFLNKFRIKKSEHKKKIIESWNRVNYYGNCSHNLISLPAEYKTIYEAKQAIENFSPKYHDVP